MRLNRLESAKNLARSGTSIVLCLSLVLNSCGGGGGGGDGNGGGQISSAPVTYSTSNGKVSRLTIKDATSARTAIFDFTSNASGQSIPAVASIKPTAESTVLKVGPTAAATDEYLYDFDAEGAIKSIVDRNTGETLIFSYFLDHVEMRQTDGSGTALPTVVVYSVGQSLIAGLAEPFVPYTLDTLTNKTDVTAQVREKLIELTGSPAPLAQNNSSFEFISSANAQETGDPFDMGADYPTTLPTIPSVVFKKLPQVIAVVGGALVVVAACTAGVCAAGAIVVIVGILFAAEISKGEVVSATDHVCLNGTYNGVDGVGRPGTGTISGNFVQGHAELAGDPVAWTWRGQVTFLSATNDNGTISGVMTRTDFGEPTVLSLRGNISRISNLANMNVLATHPSFGDFGTPMTMIIVTPTCVG